MALSLLWIRRRQTHALLTSPLSRRAVRPRLEPLEDRLAPALTINPDFAPTIKNDKTHYPAIKAAVEAAIAVVDKYIVDNRTIDITFQELDEELGTSSSGPVAVPYADYRTALMTKQVDRGLDDDKAIANLPASLTLPNTTGPVTTVELAPALAKALGFYQGLPNTGTGARVKYTISSGVITSVVRDPAAKGNGYPKNATFDLYVEDGVGGVVRARSDDKGQVISFEPTPVAGGSGYAPLIPGDAPLSDTVSANATITLNVDKFNMARPLTDADKYDLESTVFHELCEILGVGGAGSALKTNVYATAPHPLNDPAVTPRPLDLFRYTAGTKENPGHRSFDQLAGTESFFSIDGGQHDIARFNQTVNADFGDWFSDGPHTPLRASDAIGTPGVIRNMSQADLTALDVVGWTINPALPDLRLTISDSVHGKATAGTPWTYTLHVQNDGAGPAVFDASQVIVLDNLDPAVSDYGKPKVLHPKGVTGTVTASIDPRTHNLTATASGGPVTIDQFGEFDIVFTAKATTAGSIDNPAARGNFFPIAQVDPYGLIPETSHFNNADSDPVDVAPELTIDGPPAITSANLSGVTLTGTGDPTATVTVKVADGSGHSVQSGSVPIKDGAWKVSGIHASGLADGPITYTVTETAPAGTKTITAQGQKATAPPAPPPQFYWKLEKTSPQVDPDTYPLDNGDLGNAQDYYTDHVTAADGSGGTYTDDTSLVITHSTTDHLHATDVASATANTSPYLNYSHTFDATWSGVPPAVIRPGQVFTISELATVDFTEQFRPTRATIEAYGLNTHLLNGIRLDLYTGQTGGPEANIGLADEDVQVTYTAPTGTRADFPTPTGGTLNLPVAKLVIFEKAEMGFGDQVLVAQYFYDLVIGTPPVPVPAVTVSGPDINNANQHTISVSGTGENGNIIKLTLTDEDGTTVSAPAVRVNGTTWSVSGIDASGLADGEIAYSATATDGHGHTGSAGDSADKHVLAFTAAPGIVDQVGGTLTTAAGTGMTDGDTVTVTVTDGPHTTDPVNATVKEGEWSVADIDVSGLDDGTVTYRVTEGTTTVTKDATKKAAPAVAFTSTPDIDATNAHGVTVTGTGDEGDTISVVILGGEDDPVNNTATATTTVSGGTWHVDDIDASRLADGQVTYVVVETDAEGHTSSRGKGAIKLTNFSFTSAPNITAVTQHAVAVAGLGNPGATVSLTVADGTLTTPAVTATVDDGGNWSMTGIDASGLALGPVTYTAIETIAPGIEATITAGASKSAQASSSIVVTPSTAALPANAATLVIKGSGFNTKDVVILSSGVGRVTKATAASLTISVSGVLAGPLFAVVSANGVSSASTRVATVVPVVTKSVAGLGLNATGLVVNGFGFDPILAHNTVAFGGGVTGTVSSATANQLTVTNVNGLSLGPLTATVTVNGQSSSAPVSVATVVPAVAIELATIPATATTLIITGVGFSSTAAANVVKFSGGATGKVTNATPTQLTISDLKGLIAGGLTATVTVGKLTSVSTQVATVTPVVTSSTVQVAGNKTTLVIHGVGFAKTPAGNTVALSGGATGKVTASTATSITVSSLSGLTAGSLMATVSSNSESSDNTQVATVTPVVTRSTATLALGATTLSINGYGFDPTAGNNTVTFGGGVTGRVLSATPSQLIVVDLTGLVVGTLTVSVQSNGQSSGMAVQVAKVIT